MMKREARTPWWTFVVGLCVMLVIWMVSDTWHRFDLEHHVKQLEADRDAMQQTIWPKRGGVTWEWAAHTTTIHAEDTRPAWEILIEETLQHPPARNGN